MKNMDIRNKMPGPALAFVVLAVSFTGCLGGELDGLVIYTYDSFPVGLFDAFAESEGINITVYNSGDAGSIMNKLIAEKGSPQADIVLGIDNSMASDAIGAGVLLQYAPEGIDRLKNNTLFDTEHYLIPYDYGYFAIIYNEERVSVDEVPHNFTDLLDPKYKGRIVLQDPRTSSPGLGFLLWSIAVLGENNYAAYWEGLVNNGAVIETSWWPAWEAYTNGEFDFVMSYQTSPAYSIYYEGNSTHKVIMLDDTGYSQIEGMGIVSGTDERDLAERFIEFMISEDVQAQIPRSNWMAPVHGAVELPAEYSYMIEPSTDVTFDHSVVAENKQKWIEAWEDAVVLSGS